jgi:hypothetical protein
MLVTLHGGRYFPWHARRSRPTRSTSNTVTPARLLESLSEGPSLLKVPKLYKGDHGVGNGGIRDRLVCVRVGVSP